MARRGCGRVGVGRQVVGSDSRGFFLREAAEGERELREMILGFSKKYEYILSV
jgi:hypothetical protein